MTACPSCGAHIVEDHGNLVQFACGELGRTGTTNAVAGKCPNFGQPQPPISYKESIERRFGLLDLGKREAL